MQTTSRTKNSAAHFRPNERFSFFPIAVLFLTVWALTNARTSLSADQPQNDTLVYDLKPGLNYRYGVELTSGEDGKGPWHRTGQVTYSSNSSDNRQLSVMEQAKRELRGTVAPQELKVRFNGYVSSPNRGNEGASGVITMSPDGKVQSVEGQSDLSLITATVSSLVFPQLPPPGAKTWLATQHRQIVLADDDSPGDSRDPFKRFTVTMPTIPHGPNVGFHRNPPTEASVEENFNCELTDLNPNTAKIKCQIKSQWTVADKPLAHVEGEGQYTFDRTQGVMTTGYSECKLHVSADGIETTIPFQLAFRLNDALTLDQIKERDEKKRQENEQHNEQARAEAAAAETKHFADWNSKLGKDLGALKNPSARPEMLAMTLSDLSMLGGDEKFVDQVSKQQREEIGRHLIPLMKRNDDQVHSAALNAAEHWATPADLPALMQAMQTSDEFHRGQIINAIGATGGDEKSAAALAKLLDTNNDFNAAEALSKMKQYAEPAVLPVIQSVDLHRRHFVYDVLGATGGNRSQEALQAIVAKTSDGFEKMQAQQALEKIKQRLAVADIDSAPEKTQ
jgi:HEAT repeats